MVVGAPAGIFCSMAFNPASCEVCMCVCVSVSVSVSVCSSPLGDPVALTPFGLFHESKYFRRRASPRSGARPAERHAGSRRPVPCWGAGRGVGEGRVCGGKDPLRSTLRGSLLCPHTPTAEQVPPAGLNAVYASAAAHPLFCLGFVPLLPGMGAGGDGERVG